MCGCVSFPLGSACPSPWPPEAEGTHLGVGMERGWERNSAGSGLGLRAHILSEELSRRQTIRGPGHLSVCRSPQSCGSDGPLVAEMVFVLQGERWPGGWEMGSVLPDPGSGGLSWAPSPLLLHQQQAAPASLVVGLVHTDQQADSLPAHGLTQGLS